MSHTLPDSTPWYRQPWPWLLIIPPLGAVIGGIITIVLAIQSPNALVVDDYYKEGLAINQQKHRLDAASAQQLSGLLRSDGNTLTLTLSQAGELREENLTLKFIHATRADLDRSVALTRRADGSFAAPAPALPAGIWYLRLQPADMSWEIRARVQAGERFQTRLSSDEL